MSTYAVIHTGGKQYRVSPGDIVTVEKLMSQPGEQFEIDQVYLLANDGQIVVGDPLVKNARVKAEVIEQKRVKKLIIFKHRRRKGYRNTTGHRQNVTDIRIIEIVHEGAGCTAPSEKQAVVPALPSGKKVRPEKKSEKEEKKTDKLAAAALKKESAARPGQTQQQPKPEEQPAAPSPAPAAAAAAVEEPLPRTPAEPTITPPSAPAAEPKPAEQPFVPEAPPAVVAEKLRDAPIRYPAPPRPARPIITDAPAPERPSRREQTADSSPAGSNRGKLVAAAVAVLALLALLLLLGRDRAPTITPSAPQEAAETPVPEAKPKEMPPAPEVGTKRIAPVNKPEAPAQPPD